MESESLGFTGLKIPRDYYVVREVKMLLFSNDKKQIFFDELTRCYSDIPEQLETGYFRCLEEYLNYISKIDYFDTIYYNITKKCNMKCSYCYSYNENKSITQNENRIILKKIKELNCRSIVVIGGEPFCNPQFWEILEDIKKQMFLKEITIVTNGTLIDKEKISQLNDPRIVVQISLDDFRENENRKTRGRGQVEKVLQVLPIIKENHINVRIMKVLTRENIDSAKDFYCFFNNMKIPVGFFIVKKVDEALKPTIEQIKNLMDYFCNEANKGVLEVFNLIKFADNMMFGNEGFPITHCGAGITSLSIHPDGNVYPCVKRYSGKDYITNILQDNSIEEIKTNRKKILEQELVDKKEKCSKCSIKYFCGGGCRAEEQDGKLCEYNCNYFNFALEYYAKKMAEN